MRARPAVIAIALCALVLTGCAVDWEQPGPVQHSTRTIPLGKSDTVRVSLRMGAGEMRVQGGSSNLLDADFAYNVASWKPEVYYSTLGSRADLQIEQPDGHRAVSGNHVYRWDLALNDDTPISMDLHFGAGEGVLNLGSLNLKSLDADMGVGQLTLDLRGELRQDCDVRINGGVGELTVYLPRDAGIEATANGGIGSVSAIGLRKNGNRYVNDAYENGAKASIRLRIHGGVGSINLNAG